MTITNHQSQCCLGEWAWVELGGQLVGCWPQYNSQLVLVVLIWHFHSSKYCLGWFSPWHNCHSFSPQSLSSSSSSSSFSSFFDYASHLDVIPLNQKSMAIFMSHWDTQCSDTILFSNLIGVLSAEWTMFCLTCAIFFNTNIKQTNTNEAGKWLI